LAAAAATDVSAACCSALAGIASPTAEGEVTVAIAVIRVSVTATAIGRSCAHRSRWRRLFIVTDTAS
jgi:hypothetical protein